MIHVSVDGEIERRLAEVAARTGDSPDALARHALVAYLEDLEDYAAAVEADREFDPNDTVPLETLMARYGVAG